MATQFELRLIDGQAPEGELEADHLIAIVQSLKEVAIKLGRRETGAELTGRPAKRTQRVARLSIGMAPGSTRVLVRRSEPDQGVLPFEVEDEGAFDEKFRLLVESIGADERPDWVSDSLASAANSLRTALQAAAPVIEFTAGGELRRAFKTNETHKETWRSREPELEGEAVTFVGRLRVVNLDTHRLQVTDDAGNKVALPNVAHDATVGRLLDTYVQVVGTPERDEKGRLSQLHDVEILPAPPLPAAIASWGPSPATVDEILASTPGPEPGGIKDLTEEESSSFLRAIGL